MIITIDTETSNGLQAQLSCFIMGVITYENMQQEIFTNGKEMKLRILTLGKEQLKKKKRLHVYSASNYDYYVLEFWKEKGIIDISERPLIKHIRDTTTQKDYITFLDIFNLYPQQTVESIGNIIGLPKLTLANKEHIETIPLHTLQQYCARDSAIVMKAYLDFKHKLRQNNIQPRQLRTFAQCAASYVMHYLRNNPENKHLFDGHILKQPNIDDTVLIQGKYYNPFARGGNVHAFNTGLFNHCTRIDRNSFWPYCLTKIRMPFPGSDIKIENPLTYYTLPELLQHIGYSLVCIQTPKNLDIPFLGIRDGERHNANYYPENNKIIIGHYTHEELQYALSIGYTIQHIAYSVIYQEASNPFVPLINDLYQKRFENIHTQDKWFYKLIMNNITGKFNQKTPRYTYALYESHERALYEQRGYSTISCTNGLFKGEKPGTMYTRAYYCPMIYAQTTALARILLHKDYLHIGKDNLLYSDTDNIIFTWKTATERDSILKKFTLSTTLGDYKLEDSNTSCMIFGPKSYRIGSLKHISGSNVKNISEEQFDSGIIPHQRMLSEHTAPTTDDIGSFTTIETNLHETQEQYKDYLIMMSKRKVYIDGLCKDISGFSSILKNLEPPTHGTHSS